MTSIENLEFTCNAYDVSVKESQPITLKNNLKNFELFMLTHGFSVKGTRHSEIMITYIGETFTLDMEEYTIEIYKGDIFLKEEDGNRIDILQPFRTRLK
jgi:hypothetical protein